MDPSHGTNYSYKDNWIGNIRVFADKYDMENVTLWDSGYTGDTKVLNKLQKLKRFRFSAEMGLITGEKTDCWNSGANIIAFGATGWNGN